MGQKWAQSASKLRVANEHRENYECTFRPNILSSTKHKKPIGDVPI